MSAYSNLDARSRRRLTAAACSAGIGVLVTGLGPPSVVMLLGVGVGLIGASIMLAWAADAGEVAFSGRLVLATVALIAILPEFTVAGHFAYTGQTSLVTVNLSGSTTLMLTAATAMPIFAHRVRRGRDHAAGPRPIPATRRTDLATLSIAAIVSLQAAAGGTLTMLDGAALASLWILHIRKTHTDSGERAAVIGVAAALAALPTRSRRRWIGALALFGGVVVLETAEPFVNALLSTGTSLGIAPSVLIQSIVPLATEAPELLAAMMLARNHRPAQGIAVLLAASVGQSTLALGGLPLAYALGGRGTTLPLAGPDQIALLLTVATTLFAVAALVTLRPEPIDGQLLLAVFAVDVIFAGSVMRVVSAIVLAAFAVDLFIARRHGLRPLFAPVSGSSQTPLNDGDTGGP